MTDAVMGKTLDRAGAKCGWMSVVDVPDPKKIDRRMIGTVLSRVVARALAENTVGGQPLR